MRNLLVLALALSSVVVAAQQPVAQQPSAGKGWDAVTSLAPTTSLDIKLRKGSQKCEYVSSDAESLICQHGSKITLQRTDILTIRQHHRARSTATGFAIGAGTGAAVGFGATKSCTDLCFVSRGAVASLFAAGGGVIGGITGYASDFTRSVVYKAR